MRYFPVVVDVSGRVPRVRKFADGVVTNPSGGPLSDNAIKAVELLALMGVRLDKADHWSDDSLQKIVEIAERENEQLMARGGSGRTGSVGPGDAEYSQVASQIDADRQARAMSHGSQNPLLTKSGEELRQFVNDTAEAKQFSDRNGVQMPAWKLRMLKATPLGQAALARLSRR